MASSITFVFIALTFLAIFGRPCHGAKLFYAYYPTAYNVDYGAGPYGGGGGEGGGYDSYPDNAMQYSGMLPSLQSTNQATGNVINSGSAQLGSLAANGNSHTQTGPQGSLSMGHAGIGGSGIGIQGMSVNSAGAGSGGSVLFPSLNAMLLPGGGGGSGSNPFGNSASSNAMFLNGMSALKGTVAGNSDTMSGTGPGGNSYGSSSGNAMGQGQGIQLTQIANSDSSGSGVMPMPNWMM